MIVPRVAPVTAPESIKTSAIKAPVLGNAGWSADDSSQLKKMGNCGEQGLYGNSARYLRRFCLDGIPRTFSMVPVYYPLRGSECVNCLGAYSIRLVGCQP